MYRTPSFSPDGKSIVYTKEQGNLRYGASLLPKARRVYDFHSTGGKGVFVNDKGEYPTFNAAGDRIYFRPGGNTPGSLNKTLAVINRWVR